MVKCSDCGKFISYNEIENEKVDYHYQPDTDFTYESEYYSHKQCNNKNNNLKEINNGQVFR